jgi:hypothetical protein
MRVLLAAMFGLIATMAAAQERVTVEGDRGLMGLWQIAVPQSFGVNIFQNANFGPMRNIFCRVDETSDIRCLNGGYSSNGHITHDGSDVHIAWGTAMARISMNGTLAGDTLTGTFTFRLSGIGHDDPSPSSSIRFTGLPPGGDAAGLTAQLRTVVGRALLPTDLAGLGSVVKTEWLGTSPKLSNTAGAANYFSVYAIEFDQGERICGIHRDNSGPQTFKCI